MLSDEDKVWIAGLMGGFETRLSQGFETRLREENHGLETRLIQGFETRLGEEIQGVETRLLGEIQRSEARLRVEILQFKEESIAASRDMQTEVLLAFRNFSHPVEGRLRVQKVATRAFNERMDALEDRVEFLEEGGIKKALGDI